ncbi:MAG: hypothetical protein HQK54_05295 [Oligoflexales bacterium]|nr:hypothetical protein [Oligoflexales bacterium]
MIYLSAHGTLGLGRKGELEKITVLHDTQKDRLQATGLRHGDLYRELGEIKASRILLILATCHSGLGKSKVKEEVQQLLAGSKGTQEKLAEESESLLVLSASAHGETAREDDRLKGDIYTHFFIQGLSTYDRNQDGAYSALEAHDYALVKTYEYTGGRQRPTAEIRMIGSGDIVLRGHKQKDGLPVLQAYNPSFQGIRLQVEGGEKGVLPLAFPLKAGRNKISIFTAEESKPVNSFTVKAKSGDVIELDRLIMGPPLSAGLSFYQTRWLSARYRELTGNPYVTTARHDGTYHFNEFSLGLVLDISSGKKHLVRKNLEASFGNGVGFGLAAGYSRHFLGGTALTFELLGMQEELEIEFRDLVTGESLKFKDRSFSYGYQASAGYPLGGMFEARLMAQQKWSGFDFGEAGSVNSGSFSIGAGIRMRFGGYGRRL